MRALVQRVSEASVSVDGVIVGRIGRGLLVLLGVKEDDTEEQTGDLVRKLMALRIFDDKNGKMNQNIRDVGGQLMIISQFTLYANTRKGSRPSYSSAAKAEAAQPLYEMFVRRCRDTGVLVATGVFGAAMRVGLVNEGPVTIMVETEYLKT